MLFFYLFSFIPVIIGLILFLKKKEIIWSEWIIGSCAAFLVSIIIHLADGDTTDYQTISGKIVKISYHPSWVEQWTQHHSETYYSGTGSNRKSHTRHWTTTEYDRHPEKWFAERNFGVKEDRVYLSQSSFENLEKEFAGQRYVDGKQSYHHGGRLVSGDRNIYSVFNKSGYIAPVTKELMFKNKIKAAPSLFSYSSVPTNILVFPYPENKDWLQSNRLLGSAELFIPIYSWDLLNTRLGYNKKVNLILVGFINEPLEYAKHQESSWIGGKKNDLVLCYGGGTKQHPPKWAYVFGWTENNLVKRNLESILLSNVIDTNIIPLIEKEVSENYVLKDWSKFDYITVSPSVGAYVAYFIILISSQIGLYLYFHNNDSKKYV